MPKVGNKTFPYTDKGEGQAEVYAAQTGQPITREEKDSFGYGSYQGGGLFSGAEQRASAGDVMGSSGLFSGAEQRESINEYALNTAFKTAIQRELNPPKDQGHDRHLDNLKAIRAYALKNPEHFYQFMNMEEKSGDLKRLKDNLTKEFAKYGSDDINNLMWGSDEWEMDQEGMQRGGPVKRYGYQTGGVTGRGLDYSETLNDEKQMFRDKEGNYTVNLAKQYETPEGLRYYEGTGQSPDMFFAESMAETDARRVLHENPADSLVTGGKLPYAKDGLIRSILGKFGF